MNPDKKRYIESNYKFNTGDIVVRLKNDGVDDYIVGYREILGHDFCYLGGMDKYKTVEVVPRNEGFEPIGAVKLNKKEDIESLYKLKGDDKMKEIIWARPSACSEWLVMGELKDAMPVFSDIFCCAEEERYALSDTVNNYREEDKQYYDEMDLMRYEIFKIESELGTEDIDLKIVLMTESELDSIGEFIGW